MFYFYFNTGHTTHNESCRTFYATFDKLLDHPSCSCVLLLLLDYWNICNYGRFNSMYNVRRWGLKLT